ncbi:MAG: hypothetical protein ACYS9X_06000 [Planctomycetota bacterium]|jgi:hypothetical protein
MAGFKGDAPMLASASDGARDALLVIFGGLVTVALFFLTRVEDLLFALRDHMEAKKKMAILEVVASQKEPVSFTDLFAAADVRFGILRRKCGRKLRALCYRMILDGTLTYRYHLVRTGDLPPEGKVGYQIR